MEDDDTFQFSKLKLCTPSPPKKVALTVAVIQIAGSLCGFVYSMVNYMFVRNLSSVSDFILPMFVVSVILEIVSVALAVLMLVGVKLSNDKLILANMIWQSVGFIGTVCGIVISSLALANYTQPSKLILIVSGFHHILNHVNPHILKSASIGFICLFAIILIVEILLSMQIRRTFLFVKKQNQMKLEPNIFVIRL